MISLENAKEILNEILFNSLIHLRKEEQVPLWEADERILATDIVAQEDVPAFDRSPVDGFALIASDTIDATVDNPVTLKIIDTIAAGSCSKKRVVSGTAAKIFTGAPLPQGADCIIKRENVIETNTTPTSSSDLCLKSTLEKNSIIIDRPINRGENVALKGEDIVSGEVLFKQGTILKPAHLGILAALGVDPVCVYKKPKIGIFSTGNELVSVHKQLQPGQLRASNLYTLAGIIRQAGGVPINLGIIKDNVKDVVQVYNRAQQLDLPVVISTGGTASGDFDVIKDAMDEISATRLFNEVAMRPGAPAVISLSGDQLLVGLSGNPGGAAVAMLLLIFPIIAKLAGSNKQLEQSQARLSKPLSRKGGLRGFMWASYYEKNGLLYAEPFQKQFCGAIKSHADSNCLIEIPAGKVDYAVGNMVTIWKLP